MIWKVLVMGKVKKGAGKVKKGAGKVAAPLVRNTHEQGRLVGK